MKKVQFFLIGIALLGVVACQQRPEVLATEDKQHLPPLERYGELMVDVQMTEVFPDGKTFVDCIPKKTTDEIVAAYQEQRAMPDFDLKKFVADHFHLPVQYASGFKSDTSRSVSEHVDVLWDILTRKPEDANPGTLIALPNPYVVPGGRFGEIYYWDSYFTMLGLQADQRVDMIENMVDNFSFLIDSIGFIPNGNRTYFLTRSQPPFYAQMIKLLAEEKGNETLVTYLPQLQKEYDFWMNGMSDLSSNSRAVEHCVRLADGQILNRYFDRGTYPREEMYRDDVQLQRASGRDSLDLFPHIRAACESGWDFSTRWFEDGASMKTIVTLDIIPVDLNALLYDLERTLATAYSLDNNNEKANLYLQRAEQRQLAIQKYCWDPETGFFRDYNFVKKEFTPVLSLAGTFPLYFDLAGSEQAAAVAKVIEETFLFEGGLVSTPNESGQQWDAPNGWAPLQYIAIRGLERTGQTDLANTIKNSWVALNRKVYKSTGKMVEKYNVKDIGLESGGGEYPVQDGFGWTNGVLLRLLNEQSVQE